MLSGTLLLFTHPFLQCLTVIDDTSRWQSQRRLSPPTTPSRRFYSPLLTVDRFISKYSRRHWFRVLHATIALTFVMAMLGGCKCGQCKADVAVAVAWSSWFAQLIAISWLVILFFNVYVCVVAVAVAVAVIVVTCIVVVELSFAWTPSVRSSASKVQIRQQLGNGRDLHTRTYIYMLTYMVEIWRWWALVGLGGVRWGMHCGLAAVKLQHFNNIIRLYCGITCMQHGYWAPQLTGIRVLNVLELIIKFSVHSNKWWWIWKYTLCISERCTL